MEVDKIIHVYIDNKAEAQAILAEIEFVTSKTTACPLLVKLGKGIEFELESGILK